MGGALEKILEHIRMNAKVEVEKLKELYRKDFLKIEEETKSIIADDRKKIQDKIEEFKKSTEIKMNAENFIFQNRAILETKQNVFFYVLKVAVETLCCNSLFENRYLKHMEKLIERNLPDESCVLVYGDLDYLRFCNNLKFKPSTNLVIKKSLKFKWGAAILCDNFEVDLNVEHLLLNMFDNCRVDILNILSKGK